MEDSLFELSNEELTGTFKLEGEPYVTAEIKGTQPAVDFLSAPPPGVVKIYRARSHDDAKDFRKWGEAARAAVDTSLDETGAVLLRGIPVRNEEEFREFWQGCKSCPGRSQWEDAVYANMGRRRQKLAGIDTPTNIPPELVLNTHNELSYNPVRPSRIALFCLQPAETGGENLIARNEDITSLVSPELVAYLHDHGGLKYSRTYRDASTDADTPESALAAQLSLSWQEKCGIQEGEGRAEAEKWWTDHGFVRELIEWGEDGSMTVSNIETGFITDRHSGKQLWLNSAETNCVCADGTSVPAPLLRDFQRNRWKVTHGFKLAPGDWLMLDNLRVQHGRMPYVPAPPMRKFLTVYTK